MTILSTAGTIHCLQYYLFVYQVLRTFNMLTKSKISEARFQIRRTCNHVECQRHDTLLAILYLFVFPNFEEICKHVEHRRCDTYLFYQIMINGELYILQLSSSQERRINHDYLLSWSIWFRQNSNL